MREKGERVERGRGGTGEGGRVPGQRTKGWTSGRTSNWMGVYIPFMWN